MRLLQTTLAILFLTSCKGAQPLYPEDRLDDLELAITVLKKDNADLEKMIDQMDDQHTRCLMCQSSCDDATKAMEELQETFDRFGQ